MARDRRPNPVRPNDLHRDPASGPLGSSTAGVHLVEKVEVPSLNIAGWFDLFLEGTIENLRRTPNREASKLIIGPWCHVNYAP